MAALAGAVRRVEREDPGLELRDRRAAVEAGEPLGEREALGYVGRQLAGGLRAHRDRAALRGVGARLDHVDLDDAAASAAAASTDSERRRRRSCFITRRSTTTETSCMYFLSSSISSSSRRDLAVYADAAVALEAELLEELLELALAAAHDRRADDEAGPLRQRHHAVGDLLDRLALDRLAALGAVRAPDPRPEQAQVVVDLGDGADRRARVARGRLLVDRDGRRQALDRVDVGLLHQPQELARVGRERLDVAPLPLRVDGVEGEARLARAREPGHHDQRVARQLEVDALQVVLAGTGDDHLL